MFLLLGSSYDLCCTLVASTLRAHGHDADIIDNPLTGPARLAWRMDHGGTHSRFFASGSDRRRRIRKHEESVRSRQDAAQGLLRQAVPRDQQGLHQEIKPEKLEKNEIKEFKGEKIEVQEPVFDPGRIPGPDPRLEQLIQAVSGLAQQVGQLTNQVAEIKKKVG